MRLTSPTFPKHWTGQALSVECFIERAGRHRTPATGTNTATTTDTTERGLESRIVGLLTRVPDDPSDPAATDPATRERPAAYSAGWIAGEPADYDRGNCVDLETALRRSSSPHNPDVATEPDPRLRHAHSAGNSWLG